MSTATFSAANAHHELVAAVRALALASDSDRLGVLQDEAARLAPMMECGTIIRPDAVDRLLDAAVVRGIPPEDAERSVRTRGLGRGR
jgi:hypothetical protein